jgi:hypothetical protein
MATQRRLCPRTFTTTASVIAAADGTKADELHGAPCVGPACQFWHFEPGENPADGNCVDVITAIGMKLVAQLALNAFNAGQQQAAAAEAENQGNPN